MPAPTPTLSSSEAPVRTGPPATGDHVLYRLKFNSELVAATVIDTIDDEEGKPKRLLRAHAGTVHLRIELDPERHHASAEVGYRLNVPEASAEKPRAVNTYVRQRPADEDEWFKALEYRRGVELEIRRRIARGEDPIAAE